ncbi:DnaJ-domain-containing protein [Serendipita vermifera]|nr:DnaJ-domain-containing protein [Serendipita vermifera]
MDSANKDEALKALSIARRHLAASPPNISTAKKLALKSVALCETSEAMNLLERIRQMEEDIKDGAHANGSAKPTTNEASSSGTEPFAGSEGIKHRHTAHTSTNSSTPASDKGKSRADEKREYTEEQMLVVQRIRKCKATEYYEILSLKKDCEEADVKKAYRKLALQLHPDKNGAPGADEAFKMVSKAFQVLSDSSLRAAFDRDGGDPESRFGSGMRSSGAGMRSPFSPNGSFEGEISPEELFNMFFGGGSFGPGFGSGGVQFGGSPFGGPTDNRPPLPVFTTTFGPGGFRTTRVRTRQNTAGGPATQQAERPVGIKGAILQLLPIILFLLLAFSNTIFDIVFSVFSTPDPSYSWHKSPQYSHSRTTGGNLGVEYFVNPKQFASHPMYTSGSNPSQHKEGEIPTSFDDPPSSRSPSLRRFEKNIEERWVNWKYSECVREREFIDRKVDSLSGVFGIGANKEAIKKLRNTKLVSCEELKSKGYVLN